MPSEWDRFPRADKREWDQFPKAAPGQAPRPPQKKSSVFDQIGAFAQSATEQIPFLDELAAKTVSVATGRSYEDVRAVQKRLAQEDRQHRAGARNAGGVAGFGATLMAPGAGYLGGARSLGQASFRGAQVGAGYGGLYSAGAAEGGVPERASAGAKGAAIGAVTGAALPVAVRGLQTGARAVDNATGGMAGRFFGGNDARAAERLRQALQADGVDEATIRAGMAEWQRTGSPPPRLLDLAGDNTRALLHYAGTRPGEASNTLRGIHRSTRANMPAQVRARTQQLTPGEPRSGPHVVQATEAARNAAASRNYGAFRDQPVQVTPEAASALRGDIGRRVISEARENAAANRDYDRVAELDELLNGDLSSFPPIRAGTLDELYQAMRDAGAGAMRGEQPRTRLAAGLGGRARDIDSALDAVPALQPARGNFRAHSQFIEGVEDIGPNVLRETADTFAPRFEGLPSQAMDPTLLGARIGGRQAIMDLFGKGPTRARGALDLIADGIDPRRNLRALYGQQPADDYVSAISNIRSQVDNAARVDPLVGSKTHVSGADAQNVSGVASMLRGDFIQPLLERFAKGLTMTDQEAAILARLGVGSPEDALRALQQGPVARRVGLFGNRARIGLPAQIGAQTGGSVNQTAP